MCLRNNAAQTGRWVWKLGRGHGAETSAPGDRCWALDSRSRVLFDKASWGLSSCSLASGKPFFFIHLSFSGTLMYVCSERHSNLLLRLGGVWVGPVRVRVRRGPFSKDSLPPFNSSSRHWYQQSTRNEPTMGSERQ